jgi:hypothetical protein
MLYGRVFVWRSEDIKTSSTGFALINEVNEKDIKTKQVLYKTSRFIRRIQKSRCDI